MKAVNRICQIASIVFGLAAVVLFFTKFATITMGEVSKDFVGAQLAFGSEVKIAGNTYDMAKSADILLTFILAVIGLVMSAFSFKSKKLRYATPVVAIIAAVYMFVIALSNPWKFIDTRPLVIDQITEMVHSPFVLFIAIALAAFAVFSIAYLFIDDYIEVKESKGAKKTIFRRVIGFFRDYKSEAKKIVWPGIKDVIKSTVVVLIMCLLVGLLIWGLDFGLGKLLGLILGA